MVSGNSLTNSSIQQTWMYLAVPVLLYMGERILRTLRAGYYTVTVVQVAQSYIYYSTLQKLEVLSSQEGVA